MNLYIMSRGRAGKITTLKSISDKWKFHTYIVCSHKEGNIYREHHPLAHVIEAPASVTNYSQKFQYILDGLKDSGEHLGGHIERKAVILDDDLVFSQFDYEVTDGKLITVRNPDDLDNLWDLMADLLDSFPLVGVHPRQHAQNPTNHTTSYETNGRIICVQGINREAIGNVKVDQFPILADVVLNCTLLGRGQPNAIITTFFQDHGPCQAPGGCSLYRTPSMQRDAVQYLANRFPGFVKVVERKPKVAKWMGDTRYDYTCQWKKLYAAGRAHLLDPRARESPDREGGGASQALVV